jgi:acyl-coenzyme A synthetase/AMP-(fatty) acid ligase
MEASDKDGPSRGYGAVLWPPDGRTARWLARNGLRTAWTDSGRTPIVFDSERARRGHLTYAELAEQVARVARGLRELGVARFRGNPRGS